jgi:5-methylcytosine-specific restriction endonuclease McrA
VRLTCADCGRQFTELTTVVRHKVNHDPNESPYDDICRDCYDVAEAKFAKEIDAAPRPFVPTIQYLGSRPR